MMLYCTAGSTEAIRYGMEDSYMIHYRELRLPVITDDIRQNYTMASHSLIFAGKAGPILHLVSSNDAAKAHGRKS